MAAKYLSDNAKAVLTYLQQHDGEDFAHTQIAEDIDLSPRSVTGTVTGLVKRGFAQRVESDDPKVKYIKATPEGLAFDVNAELPASE